MDKKTFVQIIKELEQLKKDENDLNQAFKVFSPDWNYMNFGERYEELVIKTLMEHFNDTDEWIWYYFGEVPFLNGDFYNKKHKPVYVKINNKRRKLDTPEDLYKILNEKPKIK